VNGFNKVKPLHKGIDIFENGLFDVYFKSNNAFF